MPKMKTSRTMAKRVKFTGTGKVKVHHAGMGHLAPRKTRKQRKHLAQAYYLAKHDERTIKEWVSK